MSLVGIQFKFPNWEQKLKRAQEEINLFIAANMQTNRGMLFDAEGGRNGHKKWAPLVFRNGMILSKRGTLRKSLAPQNDGHRPGAGPDGVVRFSGATITIGTQLAYARIMNDGTAKLPGGVIRAKNAQALKIPVEPGFIKSQKLRKTFFLEQELGNEDDPKRKASLERRIERIEKLSKEVRGNRGNFIFRKSVRIPPRPFDSWTVEDQNELELALRNKLLEVLNR